MKLKIGLFYTLLFALSASYGQSELLDSQNKQIDSYIDKTIEQIGIPGVAVAIIKDNRAIYKKYLGESNLEYNVPISNKSLFRLHSLSKIFVSVGIFQLIEKNKISLEDPISKFLDDLPEAWKNIKVKNLLSHSSGLPDMREEVNLPEERALKSIYEKEIQFPVGYRASYNQTNFWLLNRIIRKITNGSFQKHISNQFQGEPTVSFSNINDIVPNRITEYKPDNKGNLKYFYFLVPEYMYGAAGMTMSLDHLIHWDKNLNENNLINAETKKKMFKKFDYQVGTGFTYGWDVQNLNNITSYGFNGGGLVNYRKFPSKNISIIWFTNGYKIPHNIDRITNTILGYVDKDLIDKTPEAAKIIDEFFSLNPPNDAIKKYHTIKVDYPFVNFEGLLNSLGYSYINKKELSKAIIIFKLNTQEFPKSSNTFDSLGEGYFNNKEFDLSKVNYQKSLKLNPANSNAEEMIRKIDTIKDKS